MGDGEIMKFQVAPDLEHAGQVGCCDNRAVLAGSEDPHVVDNIEIVRVSRLQFRQAAESREGVFVPLVERSHNR